MRSNIFSECPLKSPLVVSLSFFTLLCHSLTSFTTIWCPSQVSLCGSRSSVTLWCHSLVSLSGSSIVVKNGFSNGFLEDIQLIIVIIFHLGMCSSKNLFRLKDPTLKFTIGQKTDADLTFFGMQNATVSWLWCSIM